jgi:catechol 2,3-dioxygenase-like lactoylglutathione lyase family enzyme
MKNSRSTLVSALLLSLAVWTAAWGSAQSRGRPADVLGLAFVGHHVSDLDRSIEFFEAIDFELTNEPVWEVDEALNRLGATPGAESRTAVMTIQSSVSDVRFTLYLREFRGVERQDWSGLESWDLLSSHIDLTVDGSVGPVLDRLESRGTLRMPEIHGLPNGRNQEGFRRFAFVQDPDGLVIEYFGKPISQPGDAPAPPVVSNSSATSANIDRLGKQAGFNHFAFNIVDAEVAHEFYVDVLGGDYPSLEGHSPDEDPLMLHGWFRQATTDNNLRVELIRFGLNQGKTPPPVRFPDINVNYAGFQVADIEAVFERAREHGAITVSEGGAIVDMEGGRAVLLRDPDVGGYIQLWQPEE